MEGGVVHRDLCEAQASLPPQPSRETPPMGMMPEIPLPRFCEPSPPKQRGHVGTRRRRHAGRVREANRALSRLESLNGGRLSEVIDATGAPAPTPCGRSAREDAAAQVWEAVCRHDPPLQEKEGVDALSDIAEDIYKYAVNERCDIVDKAE